MARAIKKYQEGHRVPTTQQQFDVEGENKYAEFKSMKNDLMKLYEENPDAEGLQEKFDEIYKFASDHNIMDDDFGTAGTPHKRSAPPIYKQSRSKGSLWGQFKSSKGEEEEKEQTKYRNVKFL